MFENIETNSQEWFNLKALLHEEWKDIPYSYCLYQISNYGRIRRIEHTRISSRYNKKGRLYKGKILKATTNKQGYANFQLYTADGLIKTFKVHRLVAELFIPNPDNKPQVNHIDGNKLNNKVDNLEWCTNGENGKHAWDCGLRTRRIGKDNKSSVSVKQYDLNGNFIKEWDSIADITRQLGISHSLITNTCQGKQKTSHGYIWKYKENDNGMEI